MRPVYDKQFIPRSSAVAACLCDCQCQCSCNIETIVTLRNQDDGTFQQGALDLGMEHDTCGCGCTCLKLKTKDSTKTSFVAETLDPTTQDPWMAMLREEAEPD